MGIIVRDAIESDTDEIISLWRQLMDFHIKIDEGFALNDDAESVFREFLMGNIKSENAIVSVAVNNDEIIGYMMGLITDRPPVFKIKQCGTIMDACISKNYRHQGIGAKLFKSMKDWFYEVGMERIELQASVGNKISNPFWKSLGFKAVLTTYYM